MTDTLTAEQLLADWHLGDDNLGRNTTKALDEAGVTPAAALIAALVDPECQTDIHGNCATHGVLVTEPGAQCPHVLARAFLADQQADPEPAPCVYYDQPGHTPDQKPHPSAYENGPDDWPMCPPCGAIARPDADAGSSPR